MANESQVNEVVCKPKVVFTGRKQIFTHYDTIDSSNIVDVLKKAISVHNENAVDIDYLYGYYKGKQDIIFREKKYRPEICNKVICNKIHSNVNFRAGHFLAEDIQYVCRNSDDTGTNDDVIKLNDYVNATQKSASDIELVKWMFMVGTSYRMVLQNSDVDAEVPFECYTLDPRYTFVVYSNSLREQPVMGVKIIYKKINDIVNVPVYCCYTPNKYFEVSDNVIQKEEDHILGGIPIVEYPIEKSRLGLVELVKDLLDLKNNILSNRMDSIEQFVQAFLITKGFKISSEILAMLRENGALSCPENENGVEYITAQLDQNQIQTFVDYLDSTIDRICGVPVRTSGTTSDSSNNKAVILSYGWADTETDAETIDKLFIKSERSILKIIINIMNTMSGTNLSSLNVEIKIPRTNYENMLEKSQFFTTMMGSGYVAPETAYKICQIFPDPDLAYSQYLKWAEEEEKKNQISLENFNKTQVEFATQQANASTDNGDE